MATQRKNRREKSDRRSGADRRNEQAPVEVERRKGSRRTGLERRVELETAGDQIHAALSLLTYALEHGALLDVDRWLLETAVARLRLAMEQLGEGTDE
jgi:EAL domain-containing protein (putative c-di-GMP-specific phosphodiesterase class I)